MNDTCKIQWVDSQGNPTPDDNPAVGIATVQFFDRSGNFSHKREFPICSCHLVRMPTRTNLRHDGSKLSQWSFEPNPKG